MAKEKVVKNIPDENKETPRKSKKDSNRILELILSLPETKLIFEKMSSGEEQKELMGFLVGLTKELNDDVTKYKENMNKETAIKVIEGLVGNVKRS